MPPRRTVAPQGDAPSHPEHLWVTRASKLSPRGKDCLFGVDHAFCPDWLKLSNLKLKLTWPDLPRPPRPVASAGPQGPGRGLVRLHGFL